MFLKELAKYKTTIPAQDALRTVISMFKDSGLMGLLRLKGRQEYVVGIHAVEHAALSGAKAAGYQECLDDIEYFMEKYINPSIDVEEQHRALADFGGLKKALKNKDITQEEYDKRINSGTFK